MRTLLLVVESIKTYSALAIHGIVGEWFWSACQFDELIQHVSLLTLANSAVTVCFRFYPGKR